MYIYKYIYIYIYMYIPVQPPGAGDREFGGSVYKGGSSADMSAFERLHRFFENIVSADMNAVFAYTDPPGDVSGS